MLLPNLRNSCFIFVFVLFGVFIFAVYMVKNIAHNGRHILYFGLLDHSHHKCIEKQHCMS